MKEITVKYIDLFAGIGGIRLGLENACQRLNINFDCVFTSEIKPSAISVYQDNFETEKIAGDITKISADNIPNFDILLAGFPCQPFSNAGTRQGFLDTRGTLFFEIERILEAKKPPAVLLENVEGLVNHNQGKTLQTILYKLHQLGYYVTWKVLNSADFYIPQDRKRIYIVGTQISPINLDFKPLGKPKLLDILETDKTLLKNDFVNLLLSHYSILL